MKERDLRLTRASPCDPRRDGKRPPASAWLPAMLIAVVLASVALSARIERQRAEAPPTAAHAVRAL